MGERALKGVFILLTLCVAGLLDAKTLRKRQDVSIRQFPPQGSFSRTAVESSPIPSPKSAALRDAKGNDEIGSRRLPLRAAVESMPAKYERSEVSFRIPMRDAVERRPPAYDDDLFALTDELESLGIDPWTVEKKPGKKPEKIEDGDSPHNYVIQLPPKDREEYSQLHSNSDHTRMHNGLKNVYYGAAKPFNNNDNWNQHYAAYQPMYSSSVNRFNIHDEFQQLVARPHTPRFEYFLERQGGKSLKQSSHTPLMVCYIESWSTYRKAPMAFSSGSLPPLCSHVLYAFATLHPETFTLMSNDREYDIVQGGYRMVTGLKMQQPHLKVLISVGGDKWSSARRLSQLASTESRRASFISSAVSFCMAHGFDGVDIHWQYPGAEDYGGSYADKQNLVELLKEMKSEFDKEGLIISMTVPGSRFRIEDGYDASSIKNYVEFITLEAFDYREDRESCNIADHHSPLLPRLRDSTTTDSFYNVDYSVKYLIRSGMPAHKIVLGIPMFGRSYKLEESKHYQAGSRAAGLGDEGQYTQTKGFLAYFEICDEMASNNWKMHSDEIGSPFIVKGDQWVGFDNKESIVRKVGYLKKMGLAGAAAWAVDMDDFRGLCGESWPLLGTLAYTLRNMPIMNRGESTKTIGSCEENEEGLSSDPTNCAVYYMCRNGIKYRLYCHEGTLYDSSSSFCRVMDASECLPGQSVKASSHEESFTMMNYNQEYYNIKESIRKSDDKKMVCYVTSWAFYRKGDGRFVPEHLDTRLCSHIIYAYASLDPDKLIAKEFDPWTDIDNNMYARITALKDSKVLLGLGGWTDSSGDKYSRMISSGSTRRNFVTNLVAFLRRYGFQGLHLDWNYPKCWQSNCAKGPVSDKANFAKLIQELAEEFKRQDPPMELGVAISGYKEVIDVAYDLPSLGRNAHFLSVMSYDYHGGWESTTAHGSPLFATPGERYPQYTADYAIKYLISNGAPANKLLLGVAFYGQSYQLKNNAQGDSRPGITAVGPGSPGDLTKQPGMLSYYEICDRVKNLRWNTGKQEGAGPYAFHKDQWVGYEDPTSITEKVQYANQQNLGGIVAWTVDLDDFNNLCCSEPFPLLRAANRALNRAVPSSTNSCERPTPPVTPAPPVLTTVFDSGASTSWGSSTTEHLHPTTSSWWTPEKTTTTQYTTTTQTTTTPRTTTMTTPEFVHPTPSNDLGAESCEAGMYYADPSNCGAYLHCSGGEKKRQQCAPGLHWNAVAKLCDWPAAANCGTSPDTITPMPPSKHTTQRKPVMTTTTIATTTTQRVTQTRPTPPKRPVTTTMPVKKPDKPSQEKCINGAYYAHKDCDKFNICVNNFFISQICSPGLVWKQESTMCDFDTKKTCNKRASFKSRASPLRSPCQAGQFSAYPGNCAKYQQCLWGKLEAFDCSAGLHWNSERSICDWPASAKCQESAGETPANEIPSDDSVVIPGVPEEQRPVTSRPTPTTVSNQWTQPSTTASWSNEWKPTPKPLPSTTEDPNFVLYTGKYKIVCYFTNWAWYRRGAGKYVPEDIDANLCTHIVYGFAVLDSENLVIKPHDSWADFDNRFYDRVTAFKKKGLKVLLALGGWNDSAGDKYSRLVNNPSARTRFVNHALAFLEKNDFDGLDLDWEYPTCWQTDCSKGPDTDKAAFTAWVRELSTAFKPKGLLLSAAVSASKTIIDAGYDVRALSDNMDWIAVMAYDFHGQWDKKTGHVAPLYYHPDDDVQFFNANYSMNYWISEGAAPEKLILGMPLYGQSFTLGTSWDTPPALLENKGGHGLNVPARSGGEAGEHTKSPGFLAYYEICDRINNRQWIVEQDEEGRMGPHAYKGDQWVSYDDRNMIIKKTNFLKSLNLGGAMIWALDLDDFRNNCGGGRHPLLGAIRETLESNVVLENLPRPVQPKPELPKEPEMPQVIPEEPPVIEVPVFKPPVEPVEAEVDVPEQGLDVSVVSDHVNEYKMICYFTNWAWYRQGNGKYLPSDIDPSLCTHVLYGFAVLDTQNLIIKPHDSWADIDNKFYEKVTALKAKGIKVLLALGGWNDSAGDKYSRLVNNPAARRRFVIHALDFVLKNNFDGLDLDWEYPVCWQVECDKGPASDKDGFSALVRELKAEFGPKGLLLSAAVSPNRKVIDAGYDVPVLSENLDWIAVMTYDYHGQWDKKTGHVAPMYEHPEDADAHFNVNYTIHHWIEKGADRSKLVMGLSLYGQSFSLASSDQHGLNAPTYGGGEAGDQTRARGFLSYYEICDRIKNQQWKVVRDPRGRIGPYAYKGDQWVSFDDIPMILHKSLYIKAMGLAGGMIWALDLDDFRGNCKCEKYPLLSAASRELGLISTPQPFCQLESTGVVIPDVSVPGAPQVPIEYPSQDAVPQPPIVSQQGEPCMGRIFAADPTDCNRYLLCNNGVLQPQMCPSSLHWNKDHCDWPSNAKCSVGTASVTQAPTLVTTKAPSVITTSTSYPVVTQAPTVSTPTDQKVVCYFTNWAWYRPGDGKYKPEDIDADLCTHIAYGFAVLDSVKLTITPHDSWADIDNDFYGKVTALKAKGKKVLIAIGGWNDSLGNKYSRLVNDPASRARFVTNVVEFIEKWRFDGLDLDWEYPKCWQVDCNAGPASDKASFAAFVKELRQAFAPRGWLLSAAVSASQMVINEAYDVPSLARDLDWIAIMTYDYHGHWDKKTGHVSPLYYYPGDSYDYFNTNFSVNYWIKKGAPPSKLVLGIPMYGQSFTLVDSGNRGMNVPASGPGDAGEYTRAPGFLAYYEICDRIKRAGWSMDRDPENRVGPWARRGTQWVAFDDTKMAAMKARLAKSMGLGGAMIWALDLDDFQNKCGCGRHPLLNAINAALRDQPSPTCDY